LPRTTDAIVNDLHTLLQAAKIAPPYVMVGHSFGGLDVRLFADKYLPDISGIVLVDPAIEGWDEMMDEMFPVARRLDVPYFARMTKCETLARQGLLAPGSPSRSSCIDADDPRYSPEVAAARSAVKEHPGYWATLRSEAENVDTADVSEMKAEQRSYGSMPLIVLTVVPHPIDANYNATAAQAGQAKSMWNDLHDKVATESQRGVNCFVTDTGHHIQLYKPEIVIAAIRQVIDLVQTTGKPSCEPLLTV
jgi:pimeloyl-ACP methyl ester carboxylesterase